MAPTSTALTTKVESGSPYQLNAEQILKASGALLKHVKISETIKTESAPKKNLLADEDDEAPSLNETPIWLTLTTKKHIVDAKRLKPAKIALPHPINVASSATICLITADPQRTYKDIVASPAFPTELAARITRVVDVGKIKTKYKQYEAQRQLYAEHDMFLADDRIITLLPKALGKTFYKSSAKRPIPISLQAPAPRTDGKRIARAKGEGAQKAAEPKAIAAEIEKALQSALVHLSPSTHTAVKVGVAGMEASQIAENVEAVANALIEKHVPKKWRGVRGLHLKGPASAALPIWLADELWTDEADVLEDGSEEAKKIAAQSANVGKKRKAIEAASNDKKEDLKKVKLIESNDDKLDEEIAARKAKLQKQKAEASKAVEDEVPKATKKKSKKVAA
ncbi:ribosome biogenesis protein C8F11.04 [Phlyctema vagabunda]|uniref:Ribosome biogenesis protein C8F11.04 n=1 Tax=Phlyctema vagabunda TaxID=108571 RepID=A0ABR4PVX9_9HELO